MNSTRVPRLHQGAMVAMLWLCAIIGVQASEAPAGTHQEKITMTRHATGHFDVKLVPLAADEGRDSPIGRMSNDKQFHGDLDATSMGQMLMLGTAVKDSAAYVSIEVVKGRLHGREGSFALHHNGVMDRGGGTLDIRVVPDSGTDALTGLTGKLDITIVDGRHLYDFHYALPEAP